MASSILLIESEASVIAALRPAFEGLGYEVLVTDDGDEGVSLAVQHRPALIYLAVELPGQSGYAVCKRLKREQETESLPVFIASSTGTAELFEQHRRLKTRAEEYFTKPLRVDAFMTAARRRLGISQEGPAGADDLDDLLGDMGNLDSIIESVALPLGDPRRVTAVHEVAWTPNAPQARAAEADPGAAARASAELASLSAEAARLRDEAERLRSEAEYARNAHAALERDLDEALRLGEAHRQRCAELEQQLEATGAAAAATASDELAALQAAVESLRAELELRADDLAAAQAALESSQGRLSELQAERQQRESALAEASGTLSARDSEAESLRHELAAAVAAAKALEQELTDERAITAEALRGADAQVAEFRRQIEESQVQIDDATHQLAAAKADAEAGAERVASLERRGLELEAELNALRSSTEGSVADVAKVKAELEVALALAAEVEAERDALRAERAVALEQAAEAQRRHAAEIERLGDELATAHAAELSRVSERLAAAEDEARRAMSDLQRQVADANELNALTIEELESHQKAGAGLRAELEAARAELEAARTGLDEARTANVALSTSLEAALGDGTARQREVDELTGRLAAATANVESLLADASRTEEQLATSEGHLRRSRDEVDVLVARVAELESRVGDSDASLAAAESLATEASNVAMGLRRELAAAAERESGLEARLAEATEHASGLEARLAEATEHASGLEARLAEATGQVSGLEARLAEATGQVSGLEAELAHARQESTTLAEALATASRDLAEFREGAVEYQLRIEELTAAVARVEADKAAAGDEIVSYQAMLTQVRDERDALLAELESSREQRRKVEHELTDSAAALAAEREQVAGLTRRLSVASTNEQRLSSELLFAQDALEEVRMEHQAERAMHAAALAERESFAAGLQARLARESAAADALVGALKADIEALTRQVSDLTGTLIHREALRTGFADALAGLLSRFAAEPTLELQPPVAPGFVAAEAALAALRGESPAPAPEPVPVPEPPAPAEKPSRKRRSSSAVSAPEAVAAVAAPVVVAEVVADMVAPLAAESSAVAVDGNASSLSVEDADIEVTEEIEPESVVFDDDAFDFDSADLVIVSDEDGDGA